VKEAIAQDHLDELEEDRYIREGKISIHRKKYLLQKMKR
jgi:hypothetical protein